MLIDTAISVHIKVYVPVDKNFLTWEGAQLISTPMPTNQPSTVIPQSKRRFHVRAATPDHRWVALTPRKTSLRGAYRFATMWSRSHGRACSVVEEP